MDQALSLVQRHRLSLQSMQTCLDSAAALLQRNSSGVDLENQADCVWEVEDVSAWETNFTTGLEELSTLDPLLEDFVKEEAMGEFREKVKAMLLRNTEVKQQLDAYRQMLQRCVLLCITETSNICTHSCYVQPIRCMF